jgi:hypothetical protein
MFSVCKMLNVLFKVNSNEGFYKWSMRTNYFLMIVFSVVGCTPVTPEVQVFEPLPEGIDTPIYLTAARQKDNIKRALRVAGFRIVDRMEDSLRLMRVTIGVDQGSQTCGTLNNVRFQIRYEGRNVVEATAKGWTGSCQPNIFDEVSREMRQSLFRTTTK